MNDDDLAEIHALRQEIYRLRADMIDLEGQLEQERRSHRRTLQAAESYIAAVTTAPATNPPASEAASPTEPNHQGEQETAESPATKTGPCSLP